MRERRIFGAVCAVIFAFAGHAGAASKPVPIRTTVLPLSEGPNLPGTGASAYWMPSKGDLKRLEADLPRSIFPYYRQYLGIVQGGKRVIYINGFSANVAPEFIGGKSDWHRRAVFVDDGGRGFFHAVYDPKTRKFTGPVFNGLG